MKVAKARFWLLAAGLAVAATLCLGPLLGIAEAKISTCFDCNNVCTKPVGDWGCCQDFPGHGCIAWGVCL